MNGKKRWVKIAALLLIAGLALCAAALWAAGFDFNTFSIAEYVTNTYVVDKPFQSLTVLGDTESIALAPSEDGLCRVVCREEKKAPHAVRIDGDMLTVENTGKRPWLFINFGFFADHPSVTVYLPRRDYQALAVKAATGDLQIPADFSFDSIQAALTTGDVFCAATANQAITVQTSTGKIELNGVKARSVSLKASTGAIRVCDAVCEKDMQLHVSTGKTAMENVNCESLTSTGSTGSLTLEGVIASQSFDLQRSTGSIRLDRCDAGEIRISTGTGSVSGTLLSEKRFFAHSGTGRVSVPDTSSGGRCEISTGTGSIQMEIAAAK